MKKIILLVSMVMAFAFASAQTYQVTQNGIPVNYGDTLTADVIDGECNFYFGFIYSGSGQVPTIISSELTNQSSISVISICAGTSCFGGASTNPFNINGGVEYGDNHIEFIVPEDASTAIFKVTIYNTQNESIHTSFYVKVLMNTVGIDKPQMAENSQVTVYPNPATGIVNVSCENAVDDVVVIYNTVGAIVKKAALVSGSARVDVSDLPSGVYLYGLSNERRGLKKLVVR